MQPTATPPEENDELSIDPIIVIEQIRANLSIPMAERATRAAIRPGPQLNWHTNARNRSASRQADLAFRFPALPWAREAL